MQKDLFPVTPYRWVVLACFMGINITIQFFWICLAPVSSIASEHYGVSDFQIGLLAMLFMIVYVPLSIPASWAIDRFGFKKGVGIGAVMLGAFGLLRGIYSPNFNAVLVCTIGLAIAQPFLLNSFTTVAAKWFPLNERATASGLAMMANFAGTAGGLILTPFLVVEYGIDKVHLIYGVAAAVSAILFLVFAREDARGGINRDERINTFQGLKKMMGMRHFWYLMFLFIIGTGIFNGITTWIEAVVRSRGVSVVQAGIIGGAMLVSGVVGAIIMPVLSDKFKRRKPFLFIGVLGAIPGILGLAFGSSYLMLLISASLIGFFLISTAPVGFQFAAEMTYPAPEGTSNGLLQLAGQASVILIIGMGFLNDKFGSFSPSLLIAVGLCTICLFLVTRVKESSLMVQDESAS